MRKISLVLIIASLSALLAVAAFAQSNPKAESSSSDKSLVWHKYDKALELAAKQDKHVMVFFTTSWCGYCKKMKKSTFTDNDVYKIMSGDFVLAVVDGDSQNKVKVTDRDGIVREITERQLSRSYGVKGFPTTLFLKPDGTAIAPISGYRGADEFALVLRFISTDSWETMSFSDFAKKEKS